MTQPWRAIAEDEPKASWLLPSVEVAAVAIVVWRIMAAAAPTMKKLSLELGGKSACLVFEDADVADIAPKLAVAATIIAGQQCTAARRVIVHASRYDEMKQALGAALARIKMGPGTDASSEMGPLIDEPSRTQVSRRISETMEMAEAEPAE